MTRTCVEDCLQLDINRLNRLGVFGDRLPSNHIGTISWQDGKNQAMISTAVSGETGRLYVILKSVSYTHLRAHET